MRQITWYSLRIELAPTDRSGRGSPLYAYLFHAPLSGHKLDWGELCSPKRQPLVRRFWPDESDCLGFLIARDEACSFVFDRPRKFEEPIHGIHDQPLAPGTMVSITDRFGSQRPFRLVELSALDLT